MREPFKLMRITAIHAIFILIHYGWSQTYPLEILPLDDGLLIQADGISDYIETTVDQNLSLKCHILQGGKLVWRLPNVTNTNLNGFDGSEFASRLEVEEDDHTAILHIRQMKTTDTGMYTCVESESRPENAKSIYIFVRGETTFLESKIHAMYVHMAKFTIPCRATSLIDRRKVKLLVNDKEWSGMDEYYDPREGFTLYEDALQEGTIENKKFECRFGAERMSVRILGTTRKNDDMTLQVFAQDEWAFEGAINYTITCKLSSNQPNIEIDKRKNRLEFQCPRCQSGEQSTHVTKVQSEDSGLALAMVLTIETLSREDAGVYNCSWREDSELRNSSSIELAISPTRSQLRFGEHPRELIANENEKIELKVAISAFPFDLPNYRSSWSRTFKSSEAADEATKPIVNDDNKKIDSSKSTNGRTVEELKIYKAKATDSGIYKLSVGVGDIVRSSEWKIEVHTKRPKVKVEVISPDNLIQFDQKYYKTNSTIRIRCLSVGLPRSHLELSYRGTEGSATVVTVDPKKTETLEGTYESGLLWSTVVLDNFIVTCTATRNGTSEQDSLSILAAEHASLTWTNLTKSSKAVDEDEESIYAGDNLQLSCSAIKDKQLSMRWLYNNSELHKNVHKYDQGHSSILVANIENINVQRSGAYTCEVKKVDELGYRQTIKIEVKSVSAPQVLESEQQKIRVKPGGEHKFECKMSGTPTPNLTWWKDGAQVTEGISQDGSLLVSKINVKDAGLYECIGKNRAGTAQLSALLEVEGTQQGAGALILVTLVVFLLLICACVFLYLWHKQRKRAIEQERSLRVLYDELMRGGAPVSQEVKQMKLPLDQRVNQISYDSKFELDKDALEIGNELGRGEFGKVMMGFLRKPARVSDATAERVRLNVAVKEPLNGYDVQHQRMLINELKIMSAIRPHPNVLTLIGAVTKNMTNGRLCVVVEFCDRGSLKDYLVLLKRNPDMFVDELKNAPEDGYLAPNSKPRKVYAREIDEATLEAGGGGNDERETLLRPPGSPDRCSTSDLLSYSMQIANGMEYLNNIPCIHRDLAARNILLTKNGLCRIADFGMAKSNNKDYYRNDRHETRMPVRWMSPETIEGGYYTQASDIWSYGILLYEIFSLGGRPYPWINDDQIIQRILDGERNRQPPLAHDDIYNLMQQCCQLDPDQRPLFTDCVQRLKDHLQLASPGFLCRVEEDLSAEWIKLDSYSQWRENDLNQSTSPTNVLIERPTTSHANSDDKSEQIYVQTFPEKINGSRQ